MVKVCYFLYIGQTLIACFQALWTKNHSSKIIKSVIISMEVRKFALLKIWPLLPMDFVQFKAMTTTFRLERAFASRKMYWTKFYSFMDVTIIFTPARRVLHQKELPKILLFSNAVLPLIIYVPNTAPYIKFMDVNGPSWRSKLQLRNLSAVFWINQLSTKMKFSMQLSMIGYLEWWKSTSIHHQQ